MLNPSPPLPSPGPDTCLLYLVRHGATDNNLCRPPRLQGRRVDGHLSEQGKWQAEQVARQLAHVPLAALYASPLARAQETAEPIGRQHGLAVQTVDEFIEVDVGSWEGKSWEQIAREDPERHAAFLDNPAKHGYRDGENLDQVLSRVWPRMQAIMQQHLGSQVAVVAHNVVNRCVLATLLGLPLARARELAQDNGGINLLRLRRGKYELITLNARVDLGG